mgnify:CR=1 FL=1
MGMSAVGIQDFTLLYGLQLVASVLMIYFHFQFLTNLAEIAAQAMLPQRIPLLCLRTIRTLFTTVTRSRLPGRRFILWRLYLELSVW